LVVGLLGRDARTLGLRHEGLLHARSDGSHVMHGIPIRGVPDPRWGRLTLERPNPHWERIAHSTDESLVDPESSDRTAVARVNVR